MTTAPTSAARLRSGPRGTVVDERDVPGLGVLTTAVLDPDADLDTVHTWVTQPHTGFWGLGALTRTELRDTYAFVDGLPHHHALIVHTDGAPVALVQVYDPALDPVGEVYDVQPGDLGRGAPVTAVERVAAPQAEGARDGAPVAFGQEHHQVARHGARKMAQEGEGQRRRVAVIVEGLQVEAEHRLQVRIAGLVAVHGTEGHAGALHLGALLADVLAVLVVEVG